MTEKQFKAAVDIYNDLVGISKDIALLIRFRDTLKTYQEKKPVITITFQIKGGEYVKMEEIPGNSLDSIIDFCIDSKELTRIEVNKQLESI